MILVLMLVGYEYTIVDAAGKPPKQSLSPNRKDVPLVRSFCSVRVDAVLT